MSTEDKETEIIIPTNALESKRILGYRRRNIIEGIVFALLIAFIIVNIPFVTRVKIIFLIVMCFTVFVISCIGIKDMSITELIMNFKNTLSLPVNLHYRSINYATKRKRKKITQQNLKTNQSAAEKVFAFAKEKYKLLRGEED